MNQDSVVVLTGGSRGIGLEIAKEISKITKKIAIVGRNKEALANAAEATGAKTFSADVTDHAAMKKIVGEVRALWGPIDALVLNAGIADSAKFLETDDAMFDRIMATNVKAPFQLAREVIPDMLAKKSGRIVFMASNAGLSGYALTSAYCTSKHAVVGLMRSMASEYAKTGITVNAVCPGFVDTDMTSESIARVVEKTGKTFDEAKKSLERISPAQRFVSVQEVAAGAMYLLSDGARGVNGQTIVIDGGQVMK